VHHDKLFIHKLIKRKQITGLLGEYLASWYLHATKKLHHLGFLCHECYHRYN